MARGDAALEADPPRTPAASRAATNRMAIREAKMRRSRPLVTLALLASALLSSCNGPTAPPSGEPRAWIDAPLDGSSLPLGPVAVVAHGAHPRGLALLEFSVDGDPYRNPGPPDDPQAALVTWHQVWDPPGPGTYLLAVRAQSHAGAWSAPAAAHVTILPLATPTPVATPTPTASPTPTCTLRAQFVADVTIPDGTMLAPGASFTKTWRLGNAGDCTWGPGFGLVFSGGAQMGGASPQPLPTTVAPGATVDVSVALTAPTAFGTHRGEWMLEDPQGRRFGIGPDGQTAFWVQIVAGHTPTPAPDTQPPSVSVSHSPPGASLPTGSMITFTANASDNVGVTRIDLWVTAPGGWPTLVRTCNNTTTCSHTGGPYNAQGNLSYFAIAADAAGHEANSGATAIVIYVVVH